MLFSSTQMQETLLHPPLSPHIRTHTHTQCFSSACCVAALGVLSYILSLALSLFFQSLYLTSLVLKGISQVRGSSSARSCDYARGSDLESENGPQGVCEPLQKAPPAAVAFVSMCVCLFVFFLIPQLQVGSQSRYETTAPES